LVNEPAGQRPRWLARLASDDVWPYLLVPEDVRTTLRASGHVPKILGDTASVVRGLRDRHPGASVERIVAELSVPVEKSAEDPKVGWRYRRSGYQNRPPKIRIYVRAIDDLGRTVSRWGLSDVFSAPLQRMLLAHELYHHLENTSLGSASRRYPLERKIWGLLTLPRRVSALDEIAAHSFVQELCDLAMAPAVLDLLTVHDTPKKTASLLRKMDRLDD
jgi:hypothetical protein